MGGSQAKSININNIIANNIINERLINGENEMKAAAADRAHTAALPRVYFAGL